MNQLEEILYSSSQILPEWILLGGILTIVLVISFLKKNTRLVLYLFLITISLYGLQVLALYSNIPNAGLDLYSGLIHLDKLSLFIKQVTAISAFVFAVHARIFRYNYEGEIFLFVLFLILGISIMSMTTHFMVLFVGIELTSLSSYVLASTDQKKTQFEAAIKYLIFGATASAIMLFGMSLFYGMTGSLNFAEPTFIAKVLTNHKGAVQIVSFMVLGGLLFKTAAVPFHHWVPDVYQATSTPVISFLSFAPKAAGFVVIARLVEASFADLNYVLGIVIILSLVVGNFAALWQTNFKRMLGYSGISQAAFILIGLIKSPESDFHGAFFYLLTYLPITMGSFILADLIYKKIGSNDINAMSGLGKKYPFLTFNASIIMISLIGLPPTIGFTAKLVVFSSLAETALYMPVFYALIVFGLLNAAIAIYYYMKPVYYMYFKDLQKGDASFSYNTVQTIVLMYISFILIFTFIYPNFLSEWVRDILVK